MRIGIGHKIFLGFLLAALVVLALTTGVTRWSFERGFLNYVNENEAEALRLFRVETLRGIRGGRRLGVRRAQSGSVAGTDGSTPPRRCPGTDSAFA